VQDVRGGLNARVTVVPGDWRNHEGGQHGDYHHPDHDGKEREPTAVATQDAPAAANGFARSIQAATVVVGARDVAATLAWYASIGFTEMARFPTDGRAVFWGLVKMGAAELTFDVRETAPASGVSLLVTTDRVRELYEFLSSRQLGAADVRFVKTLHEPEHGGLEFSIRDPNGFTLRFLQNPD